MAILKKTRPSPIEAELTKIEQKEDKLRRNSTKQGKLTEKKNELEEKIPEKVMTGLEKAFSKAFYVIFEKGSALIEKTYDKEAIEKEFSVNDFGVDLGGGARDIRKLRNAASGSNAITTAATTIEGIGLGVLGIGLPDIAIWVGVLLRGVYETSLKYGFDYNSPYEKMLILRMIEVAMTRGEEWDTLNRGVDDMILGVVEEPVTSEEIKRQIEKTSNAFATEMLVTKFIQGLPVVGMIGGAANPIYYQKIIHYVQLKYRKRYLLGKAKCKS